MSAWRHLTEPQRLRRIQAWAVIGLTIVLPIGKAPAETALVIGILAWVTRGLLEQRRPFIPRTPLNGLLVLWLALAVCSISNSIDIRASLQGLQKLLKVFALYLVVWDTVETQESLSAVIGGCLVGLLVVVLDGLWQAVSGVDLLYRNIPWYTLPSGVPVMRLTATFDHPASLAIHLVSFCPLAIAWGWSHTGRWGVALRGFSLVTLGIVVLNRTRGGILGCLAALVALAIWRRHWLPVAQALLLAWLQVLTMPASVKAWSASMPSLLHRLTEPERLMYWQAAWNMIQAHPLIGVGINTFVKAYPRFRLPGDPYGQIGPYAHSQYLQLAAELGVAGLAVFLGLLIRVFFSVHRSAAHRQGQSSAIAAGLGAGLVGYLVVGELESALFYGRGSLTFWLLVGLIMAIERLRINSALRN